MAYLFQRGKNRYYLKYYVAGRQKEKSLGTDAYQIAKERQRQFESALARGTDDPLPARTPIAEVLEAYTQHIRATKTAKSAQNDIYYLRQMFGPICEGLTITSRRPSTRTKKCPTRPGVDRRFKDPVIEASHFEAITTAQIAAFIEGRINRNGIAAKTANHHRSILRRLFNWARKQHGIKMPDNTNPAAEVEPYKEHAPQIRYLTLEQIDEQLHALRGDPKLQTAVAILIYAGLRREELLWLKTADDIDLSKRATRNGGHGFIRIQAKTIVEVTPDGESRERFWEPKTKVNRIVPVSSHLRPYLDRYTPEPSDEGWHFPSPGSRTLWDPDNFSERALKKANKKMGLWWTCLDYRHSFGSHLVQNGVTLYKVSKLMGNSPEICRRHYAHLVPEALTTEVEFGSAS